MGRDKARLEVAGELLWLRQLRLARTAGAGRLFLSCRGAGDYEAPGVTTLVDATPGGGPLEGIAAALAACEAERLLVLAVDLPALSLEFLHWLLLGGRGGVVPLVNGQPEPLAALYPKEAFGEARARCAAGERSVRAFAQALVGSGRAVALPLPEAYRPALLNWNRPGDWSGGGD